MQVPSGYVVNFKKSIKAQNYTKFEKMDVKSHQVTKSSALLLGTEVLFWAALINGLAYMIFSYMKAYITARPAMKKLEMAAEELTARRASYEEIASLESFPVEPEDELRVPKWIYVINNITAYMILVFIIVGIIIRIFK